MKCPHLIKWLTLACKAQENLYFPSTFQLQEYCKRKYHKRCPFYADNAHAEEIEHVVSAARP